MSVICGPTMTELRVLRGILRKAQHPSVAEGMLKGFMWAVWPEWYDRWKNDLAQRQQREAGADGNPETSAPAKEGA